MSPTLAFSSPTTLRASQAETIPASLLSASSSNEEQPFLELVRATAREDQAAFTKLYNQTNHLVFGLTLYMLKDRCVAEEVVLDVYLQAWRKARQFDTGRGSPLTWLMMMARSRALDHLRKAARNKREMDSLDEIKHIADKADDPEKSSELAEQLRLLRVALTRLRPEERELIEAAFYDGLSHGELAAHFLLPLGTVKTRIRTAITRLRETLCEIQ